MDLRNKEVLVFGAGISGVSASALLLKNEAAVILYDGNEKLDKKEIEEKILDKVSAEGFGGSLSVITGELPEAVFASIDMVVLSPGIPTDLPIVERFRAAKTTIIGEVELAYLSGAGKVYAVTGTNGKTTTTTLLGELMKAVHPRVDVVGNIGNPYTDAAAGQNEESVTVAEISSFQLETIDTFHPCCAVLTNITEDHLNRHHTMENYINCKKSVVRNQTKDDCCILNYEDEVLRDFAKDVSSKVVFFSSERKLDEGLYLEGDKIVSKCGDEICEIVRTGELQIVGKHNYENVMAAAAAALYDGIDVETIRKVLREFGGVEHRIEYVGTFDGVKYYNDSKGTNPAAAIKGIQAMSGPTFLIAGGYDKQSEYEEWIGSFDGKVKKFVLIGETKMKIADAARRCGMEEERIVFCEDLKEAVEYCRANAVSGDAVLLSPACASWDQFENYELRGVMFKEYVRNR